MSLITIFIIAMSISMDAFSLSLLYGTKNIDNKKIILQSLLVGLFHFFMPLFGLIIGHKLIIIFTLQINIIISVVLIFIGLEMVISSFKPKEKINILYFGQLILFAFTVSIDSFAIGIILPRFTNNYLISLFIFFSISSIFTFLGLKLGKKINELIGKIATVIGGCILFIIGLVHLLTR